MRLGVPGRFSPHRDATLGAVVDAARRRGHEVVVLDIARLVSGPVAFEPTTGRLRLGPVGVGVVVDLDDLDVLLLGPLPSASARLAPPGAVLDADAFDVLAKRQAARHALAWSIALSAEARGVPVVSSPSRARPFDHKPFQVAALHAAGVAVPDMLVVDHDSDDGDDDDDAIVKPVIGGPVVLARDHVFVAGAPVLRQPRLRGRQLRLAVVGGEVIAVGGLDIDDGVVDGRLSQSPWRSVGVTPALKDLGLTCARTCAFDLCAIDAVDTGEALVVLDVNRTPQLMDLAALTGVDIAGAVVRLLERRAR